MISKKDLTDELALAIALCSIGLDIGKTYEDDVKEAVNSDVEKLEKLERKDFEGIWVGAHYLAVVNPGTRDFIDQHPLYSLEVIDSVAAESSLYDKMMMEELDRMLCWLLKIALKAYYYENKIYERVFLTQIN
ncbi:hypothetical protein IOQ59_10970 [Pontibacterium sp. N1Y112]|uniref:Uncharacterized protein n=1 Tax=Pontibacterium sinense TaxID=2781979 RepID=A0A8J7FDM2_9GAMM|nr:hypothetical protein [Pontibacterium sinense]MBE9397779.1 hypothetical protein [Pontibacterium sinense]